MITANILQVRNVIPPSLELGYKLSIAQVMRKHCYIHLNDEVMHQLLDIGDEDLR